MPAEAFQYALLQVVPRLERGERINAGVVVHCRRHGFLAARVGLDVVRLHALHPDANAGEIRAHLDHLAAVATGEADDPVAGLERSERFHWLVAPSSTVVQASAVHTGLTEDPAATLERLYETLVA